MPDRLIEMPHGQLGENPETRLMTYNVEYQCLLGSCPSFSTLSVTVVNDGTVTSNPPGIDCGANCSERYFTGTVVTLTATPEPGGGFDAWSGDPDCLDGIVTMTETLNCIATFVISENPPTSVDDTYTTFVDNPIVVILDVTGSLTTSLSLGLVEKLTVPAVPGGTYTLRLRVANAGGSSAPSDAVTLTVPQACAGAPEVPENFLAYRIGNTLFVVWDPPESGPAPTQYVINVTGSFVGTFVTTERTANGVVGPGTYGLSVSARNACGSSPITLEQMVTVPQGT